MMHFIRHEMRQRSEAQYGDWWAWQCWVNSKIQTGIPSSDGAVAAKELPHDVENFDNFDPWRRLS